jgi:hypothetical protein
MTERCVGDAESAVRHAERDVTPLRLLLSGALVQETFAPLDRLRGPSHPRQVVDEDSLAIRDCAHRKAVQVRACIGREGVEQIGAGHRFGERPVDIAKQVAIRRALE